MITTDTPTTSEPVSLREATVRLAAQGYPEGRWPPQRLGKRQYISRYIRRAIFERDGGRCLSCGDSVTLDTARLDHIVPWSAGGSDASRNLRILCEPCNTDRSNFHGVLDVWAAKRPPVAFCCTGCAHLDHDGTELHEAYPVTPEMVAAFCANCGIVSRTWPEEVW